MPEKAASRQSFCPAGRSWTVSSTALKRQELFFGSSSASSSGSGCCPQSRSGAREGRVAGSSSCVASSRLPKAKGPAPFSIESAGRGGGLARLKSLSLSGTGGGGGGATRGSGGGSELGGG